ncbi:hypothetical protein HL42_4872 [Trichophyton rubrum]|nr:hypothetical protein HL42_4872 [Trichophyton rubrum]
MKSTPFYIYSGRTTLDGLTAVETARLWGLLSYLIVTLGYLFSLRCQSVGTSPTSTLQLRRDGGGNTTNSGPRKTPEQRLARRLPLPVAWIVSS